MLFDLFAERLPRWFHEHVERLKRDHNYRENWIAEIKRLPLAIWYRSPKWKCTAQLQLLAFPTCHWCETKTNLEVHHLTYEHLGAEVLHMEDLQTVCATEHRQIHSQQMPLYFPPDHVWYHNSR